MVAMVDAALPITFNADAGSLAENVSEPYGSNNNVPAAPITGTEPSVV
jgi:hypothetical protein